MTGKESRESYAIVEGLGKFSFPNKGDDAERFEILSRDGNQFRIRMDDHHFNAVVTAFDSENKVATINIGGNDFHIRIMEPLDQLIEEMGFLQAAKHSVREIRSPMPGLVVDIFVTPGQEVSEGDRLFSLEAMKMENIVKSPGDGVVEEIYVSKGSAVDKNQLIILFQE